MFFLTSTSAFFLFAIFADEDANLYADANVRYIISYNREICLVHFDLKFRRFYFVMS